MYIYILYTKEYYIYVYICLLHSFFIIPSSTDRYLICFPVMAIVNTTALNMVSAYIFLS